MPRPAQRLLAAALLGGALSWSAAAHGDGRVIAAGVSAGGVDLSNLTVDAAAARLSTTLGPRVQINVVVGAASHVFRLTPAQAKLRFDAITTAKRAYDAGARAGSDPATRGPVSVPLAISHSHRSVQAFVADLARRADRPPHDASVHITVRHIFVRRSHPGHHVDQGSLVLTIDAALDSTTVSRVIHVHLARDAARLNEMGLAHRYATVVTIDRGHFRLRLFKHLRFRKSYGIAVGRAGLETPRGIYHVTERQINPAWHVPNRSWAGALAGQTISGGSPSNPLKARWLGLADGVGIHGTAEDWSIGTRASHGCIRMHVHDVIELYRRVPLGTPVLVH
jgi:hypothetical protein